MARASRVATPTTEPQEECRMRVRASAVVNLCCALVLCAGVARAQDPSAAAPPADTAKKAAAPAKAAPAGVDAAVKAIDAQITKMAVNKKDPDWKTKLK